MNTRPWRPPEFLPQGTAPVLACLALLVAAGITAAALLLWMERARRETRYDPVIFEAARRHGVSPFLVKAVVWKESRFRPDAVGGAGEVGLMQITDIAVREYHRVTGRSLPPKAARFSPRVNVEIGAWYLGRAVKQWQDYRSGEILALCEYNAGPSRARNWAPEDPNRELTLNEVRIASTRDYIKQVRQKKKQLEKENRRRDN
ncbi:MAG: transglycosylase SLT domain-containing protein [Lentisphaeria bacterium]|nr:transglycosylase SLT domain-containing protein [Lentisphaeria bacterium]